MIKGLAQLLELYPKLSSMWNNRSYNLDYSDHMRVQDPIYNVIFSYYRTTMSRPLSGTVGTSVTEHLHQEKDSYLQNYASKSHYVNTVLFHFKRL